MSCGCQSTEEQLCGCCAGVTQSTPAVIANRPALPSIRYRAGTYTAFLSTMEAALSGSAVPSLAGLRTRATSDFSLALVDAWAEALDILTFYTERLANEAYVGTAIEGRSVFELARLVGYKPSPGVSASTVLAFTLASAPGSPAVVPIAAGTRVQSVPGPGQRPQVFETTVPLSATIANNAIPAATTLPWQLFGADTSTWIAGTANNIHTGDALLFLDAPGGKPSTTGPAAVVFVTAASIDPISANTLVSWDQPLPSSLTASTNPICLYIFRTKAALFGAAAPVPALFPATTLPNIPGAPSDAKQDWNWVYTDNQPINLDNAYPGLHPSASASTPNQLSWMVLTGPLYTSFFQIKSAAESNPRLYGVSAKTTQLTLSSGTVLTGNHRLSNNLNELLFEFVQETRTTTAYVQSQLLPLANLPRTVWPLSGSYPLAPGMLAPVEGKALTLKGLQPLANNAPVSVNGRRVRIAATSSLSQPAGFTPAGATGALPVSPGQAFLVDAFPPATDSASGNLLWSVLTVTGQAGTLATPPGSFQLQPSASADPLTGEAALIGTLLVRGATTDLTLTAALARLYDTATVTVNANAVEATHGETMQEIVGSGDGTNPGLQFQLKQSPLTYTSASTASGVQSTLQVRVNNLLWNEVPDFLSSCGGDRAYVTRPSSTGGPVLQFGNGLQGSRTPTGQANIRAQYRKGIGVAGMVAAGQLTQPLDRPQGLQAVINPGPATGGADPATPANARESAPLRTLTLGRVVSLEDYQNFALGFAGIAMALATWTWFNNTRGIFLTLAGEAGTTLDPAGQTIQNLMTALATFGLPYVPVLSAPYVPVLFEVSMQIKVDAPTYDPAAVVPQVWSALASAFAFGAMKPGQGVAASRLIQIAQQIPGVVAVNLTALGRSGAGSSVANLLCASGPNASASAPRGAEILLLDPASLGNVGVWS